MTDLTSILKSEIARISRKEMKGELQALRKVATLHRAEIAALKRDLKSLATQLRAVKRVAAQVPSAQPEEPTKQAAVRFSASGLSAQRKRLGLTQQQMAAMLGVSSLSVWKWESGKVAPRRKQAEKIAHLRKLGKKEVAAWVASNQ